MTQTLDMSGADRSAVTVSADETEQLRLQLAQLKEKLASQPVIEQAKGMLMQTYGLSADDAFDLLRMLSQNSNVRLRWIARCVVESWTRRGPRADFDAASEFLLTLRDRLRTHHATAGARATTSAASRPPNPPRPTEALRRCGP